MEEFVINVEKKGQLLLKIQNLDDKMDAAIKWSNACCGDASAMTLILADIERDIKGFNVDLQNMGGNNNGTQNRRGVYDRY